MKLVGCVALSCCVALVVSLPAPAGSADDGSDVLRVESRQLQIPVLIKPAQRDTIKELQLFASTDEGRTWQRVASLRLDGDAFRFEAPGEGIYWFSLRIVKNDGTAEPANASRLPAALKVQVGASVPKPRKDEDQAVQDLKGELKALRRQLETIEKRLSEIEKAK
jgi:hypothetical protein